MLACVSHTLMGLFRAYVCLALTPPLFNYLFVGLCVRGRLQETHVSKLGWHMHRGMRLGMFRGARCGMRRPRVVWRSGPAFFLPGTNPTRFPRTPEAKLARRIRASAPLHGVSMAYCTDAYRTCSYRLSSFLQIAPWCTARHRTVPNYTPVIVAMPQRTKQSHTTPCCDTTHTAA